MYPNAGTEPNENSGIRTTSTLLPSNPANQKNENNGYNALAPSQINPPSVGTSSLTMRPVAPCRLLARPTLNLLNPRRLLAPATLNLLNPHTFLLFAHPPPIGPHRPPLPTQHTASSQQVEASPQHLHHPRPDFSGDPLLLPLQLFLLRLNNRDGSLPRPLRIARGTARRRCRPDRLQRPSSR